MSIVHTIIHTMQASYYDNQPKINHNRSNTQWHNIVTSPTILPSFTRLVSPLPVPSGQRGWLFLHQRWRSLLSITCRPPTPSAPSRSLRSANVDDLCRRPALTISAVDTVPSTDVKRALTLLQTTSACRSPAMSPVRYLSVAHSPLIYCPTAQTTKEGHHVVFVLCRSHVLATTRQWKVASHPWRRAVWSRSRVTSRFLVAIFRHRLSDQTPPGTATSPTSLTAVAC